MKQIFFSVIACASLGVAFPAIGAGWNPDPEINLLVSGPDAIGQDLPVTSPSIDGSTWVAWLSWEDMSACLKLQRLSKEGESLLGENGIYISTNETPTWSSGYDMISDSEGNAIIVYSDSRNGTWQAYAYKVSKEGEMLWGEEGIALSDNKSESCLNPKICKTDKGNYIFGYQSLRGSRNSIKFAKLNPDGSKAWGGLIEITGTNGLYNMVPSDNDSFFTAYYLANEGHLCVDRYTANGESAWNEPQILDYARAIISLDPVLASDNRNGVLVAWRHGQTDYVTVGVLQRLSRDGEGLWDGGELFPTVPVPVADYKGNISVVYNLGVENMDNIIMKGYTPAGEPSYTTKNLLPQNSGLLSIYGLRALGEDLCAVYRNASTYNQAVIGYCHVLGNGELKDIDVPVSMMAGDKGRGSLSYDGDSTLVLAWGDNGMAKGGGRVYAQDFTLDVVAGLESPKSEKELSSISAFYSEGNLFITGIESGEITVRVYDMSGKILINSENIHSLGGTVVVPSRLTGGIFMVAVEDNSGINSTKLIVR